MTSHNATLPSGNPNALYFFLCPLPSSQVLLSPSVASNPPTLLQPLKALLIHSIQNLCSSAFRGPSRPPTSILLGAQFSPPPPLQMPLAPCSPPASMPPPGLLTTLPRFSSTPHQQGLLRLPSPQFPEDPPPLRDPSPPSNLSGTPFLFSWTSLPHAHSQEPRLPHPLLSGTPRATVLGTQGPPHPPPTPPPFPPHHYSGTPPPSSDFTTADP